MRTVTKLALAFGAGAVAMYLLDPATRRRRAVLARDHAIAAGLVGEFERRQARRDAPARDEAPPTDQELHDRIRDKLDYLVAAPDEIDVDVHYGHVMLTGTAEASEIDGLLAVVGAMAGVEEIDNGLVVQRTAGEEASGAQVQTH
jgi:osmotically-inducible protein OsmY